MPVTLRVALGLLWLEFVALAGLVAFFAALVITQPTPLGFYVLAFGVAFAAVFFIAVRLLQRRLPSGRAAATALQLLTLAPAYYMIQDDFPLGWLLGALIVVVLGLLFAPATTQALKDGKSPG